MHVIIGNAKVNLSEEYMMSPGSLPNGSFFNTGYNRPIIIITDPNKIKNFCISIY
jgi:hypothetical protein